MKLVSVNSENGVFGQLPATSIEAEEFVLVYVNMSGDTDVTGDTAILTFEINKNAKYNDYKIECTKKYAQNISLEKFGVTVKSGTITVKDTDTTTDTDSDTASDTASDSNTDTAKDTSSAASSSTSSKNTSSAASSSTSSKDTSSAASSSTSSSTSSKNTSSSSSSSASSSSSSSTTNNTNNNNNNNKNNNGGGTANTGNTTNQTGKSVQTADIGRTTIALSVFILCLAGIAALIFKKKANNE